MPRARRSGWRSTNDRAHARGAGGARRRARTRSREPPARGPTAWCRFGGLMPKPTSPLYQTRLLSSGMVSSRGARSASLRIESATRRSRGSALGVTACPAPRGDGFAGAPPQGGAGGNDNPHGAPGLGITRPPSVIPTREGSPKPQQSAVYPDIAEIKQRYETCGKSRRSLSLPSWRSFSETRG